MKRHKNKVKPGALARACALVGACALMTSLATVATAQSQTAAHSAATPRQFDVAPATLASALLRFADQAGVQFSVDAALTEGKNSGGVKGSYTLEGAMRLLLANSGLVFRFAGPRTIVIEKRPDSKILPAAAFN